MYDDYAGEYDDIDLTACDEILGPAEVVDEDDWLDYDDEEE